MTFVRIIGVVNHYGRVGLAESLFLNLSLAIPVSRSRSSWLRLVESPVPLSLLLPLECSDLLSKWKVLVWTTGGVLSRLRVW